MRCLEPHKSQAKGKQTKVSAFFFTRADLWIYEKKTNLGVASFLNEPMLVRRKRNQQLVWPLMFLFSICLAPLLESLVWNPHWQQHDWDKFYRPHYNLFEPGSGTACSNCIVFLWGGEVWGWALLKWGGKWVGGPSVIKYIVYPLLLFGAKGSQKATSEICANTKPNDLILGEFVCNCSALH